MNLGHHHIEGKLGFRSKWRKCDGFVVFCNCFIGWRFFLMAGWLKHRACEWQPWLLDLISFYSLCQERLYEFTTCQVVVHLRKLPLLRQEEEMEQNAINAAEVTLSQSTMRTWCPRKWSKWRQGFTSTQAMPTFTTLPKPTCMIGSPRRLGIFLQLQCLTTKQNECISRVTKLIT